MTQYEIKGRIKGVLAIIGVLLVVFNIYQVIELAKIMGGTRVDFYHKYYGSGFDERDNVSIEVFTVLGNYAETEHTYGIIPIGKDQHYIVWLEDGSVISISTSNLFQKKELEKLYKATWDYFESEDGHFDYSCVKTFNGTIGKLNSELDGFYRSYLDELGYTEDDGMILDMTINISDTPVAYLIKIGVSALIQAGILMFILIERKRYNN